MTMHHPLYTCSLYGVQVICLIAALVAGCAQVVLGQSMPARREDFDTVGGVGVLCTLG